MKYTLLLVLLVGMIDAEEVQCYWGEKYRGPGFYFMYSQQMSSIVVSNYTGKKVMFGTGCIELKEGGRNRVVGIPARYQLLYQKRDPTDNVVKFADNDYMIPMKNFIVQPGDVLASEVIQGPVYYTFDKIDDITVINLGR